MATKQPKKAKETEKAKPLPQTEYQPEPDNLKPASPALTGLPANATEVLIEVAGGTIPTRLKPIPNVRISTNRQVYWTCPQGQLEIRLGVGRSSPFVGVRYETLAGGRAYSGLPKTNQQGEHSYYILVTVKVGNNRYTIVEKANLTIA